ncbi:MAG: hypothetical protein AABZ10_01345 [Nitrospirota bacterium]
MNNESLLLFINTTLYLIMHNLKVRRFAKDRLKLAINALFSGFLVLIILIIYRSALWRNKLFFYIDIILIALLFFIVVIQLVKNYEEIKSVLAKTFNKKSCIIESLFLSALLVTNFIVNSVWLISFFVFMGFLVKEIYIMSDFKKKYWE